VTSEHRVIRQAVLGSGRAGVTAVVLAAIEPVVRLALPTAIAAAVDVVVRGRPPRVGLTWLVALLLAVTALEVGKEVLTTRLEAGGAVRLRTVLLDHVLDVGLPVRRDFSTGDLISRTLGSVEGASKATPVLAGLVTSGLTTAGGLVALFLLDVRLGLLFVLAAPVLWWLTGWLVRRVGSLTTEYQRASSLVAARLVDALGGARTIRASGTVEQEVRRVLAPLPQLHAAGTAYWTSQRAMAWRVGLLLPALQIGVLATAGWCVAHARLTPGELLASQLYLGHALGLLKQVALVSRLAHARASAARIAQVLGVRPVPSGTMVLPPGPGALRLDGVRVHRAGRALLRGVDLHLPIGRTVALVGPSGSGKSTLAWVAAGLMTPDEGTVRLDGVALSDLAVGEVQRGITCAFERPNLLGETIEDALRYSDHPAPADQVFDALRTSASQDFVRRLPRGTRTPVARLRLSGGELQRLGLARAVCRDARVVVMDDATSSMDTATEAAVLGALAGLAGGRTRLVVTHRRSTAAAADLVAWLEDGVVRALAPHAALIADPAYREVFGPAPANNRLPA
jgi:ATP-binding cassette, subfamily B, bacterial